MNRNAHILVLIENPNFPQILATAIQEIGQVVERSNNRLKTTKGNTFLLHQHKDIVLNTAKLELLKLKEEHTANLRYGTGSSHFWMSMLNQKNIWERFLIVTFENFES